MSSVQGQANNFCTTSGLLTGTGGETVYDTTVTIAYNIGGQAYTKTAVTDGATPTTDGNTGSAFTALAASQACVFVWCLNSSGTVSLRQGPVVDLDASGNLKKALQFPQIPDSVVPFAYTYASNASTGSAWTIGTSNWNATGMTATHRNVHRLPKRPITS